MNNLRVIACLWIAILGMLQAPPNKGTAKNQSASGVDQTAARTNTQRRSTSAPDQPVIVLSQKIEPRIDKSKVGQSSDDIEIQRQLAKYTKNLVWVGIGQAVVLALTLLVIWRQAKLMKTHADHLKSLADAAESNTIAAGGQLKAMQDQLGQMGIAVKQTDKLIEEAQKQAKALIDAVALREADFQQWIAIDKWKASLSGKEEIDVGFDLKNSTEWPLTPLRTYVKIGTSESLRRHDVVLAPGQTYTVDQIAVAIVPGWRVQYTSGNAPMLPVLLLITYRNCLKKETYHEVTGLVHFSPFGTTFQLMDLPNLRVGEWYEKAKQAN